MAPFATPLATAAGNIYDGSRGLWTALGQRVVTGSGEMDVALKREDNAGKSTGSGPANACDLGQALNLYLPQFL